MMTTTTITNDELRQQVTDAFAEMHRVHREDILPVPAWVWRVWPFTKWAAVLDELDTLREMSRIRLNDLSVDERDGWVMSLSHDIIPLLGEALVKNFEDRGAVNFVQFRCDTPKGEYTLTLQRRDGLTPSEKLAQAEARLQHAREEWHKTELNLMRCSTSYYMLQAAVACLEPAVLASIVAACAMRGSIECWCGHHRKEFSADGSISVDSPAD
jgi:hypothetical protein